MVSHKLSVVVAKRIAELEQHVADWQRELVLRRCVDRSEVPVGDQTLHVDRGRDAGGIGL